MMALGAKTYLIAKNRYKAYDDAIATRRPDGGDATSRNWRFR